MPRELLTYDTETDPFHNCSELECEKCHGGGRVPAPFLHGIYNGETEEYEEFETTAAAVANLEQRKAVVYAHNGGKFDYHALRDHINSDEPVMVINGRLSRFRIGTCEFRDSLNIFPNTRLADFGVKNEINYANMESGIRDDPNVRAEISRYLRQDCVGLWDMVSRYRREYGKSLTQATASMKRWEKMSGLDAPRQTYQQHKNYQPYYYGGRVQCFESGVQQCDFSVADINSAYPFAMLQDHMFSPEAICEDHLPPEPEIYRCLIKLDCTSRGALPWRDPKTRELYFPDDEGGHRKRMRTYTITGWEFMAGLELNALSNIHIREVHTFTQTQNFKEYIEFFYHQRMEAASRGDVAGKIFGKYFMNSLYGKFGANCANYAEYVISHPGTPEFQNWTAKGFTRYKPWGLHPAGGVHSAGGERWLLQREPTEDQLNDTSGKWRFYNVATAASVTGFVRAHLFRALSTVSGAVYCDTDSIAARDTAQLQFGGALGQWKDEGRFDSFAIAGKKLYAFHVAGREQAYDPTEKDPPEGRGKSWKVASKGVNFHHQANGPELIARIARGEMIQHLPEVPTYSVTREQPVFISRNVSRTYKDMSVAPDVALENNSADSLDVLHTVA